MRLTPAAPRTAVRIEPPMCRPDMPGAMLLPSPQTENRSHQSLLEPDCVWWRSQPPVSQAHEPEKGAEAYGQKPNTENRYCCSCYRVYSCCGWQHARCLHCYSTSRRAKPEPPDQPAAGEPTVLTSNPSITQIQNGDSASRKLGTPLSDSETRGFRVQC